MPSPPGPAFGAGPPAARPRLPAGRLPDLPIVDWPDDDDDNGRLHWKTRHLVEWAAGRRLVWVDDEITDADRTWVAANYSAPALLHRVDPAADYCTIGQWLKKEGSVA